MAVEKIRLNQFYRHKQIERDGYRCQRCKVRHPETWRDELVVHHIIPYKLGGTNVVGNMTTLCHACHNFWHRIEVRLGKVHPLDSANRYVAMFHRYMRAKHNDYDKHLIALGGAIRKGEI